MSASGRRRPRDSSSSNASSSSGVVVHPGRVAAGWRWTSTGRVRRRDGRPAGAPPAPGARAAPGRPPRPPRPAGAGIDRAPRTPSRSPASTNPPSPDDEGQVVRSRAGRRGWPGAATSPASSGSRSSSSRTSYGSGRPPPGPARTGTPRRSATASAPAAWSGSTWVRATASIGPPRSAARSSARSSAGTGRVARVDEHEPAAPDEVGADRLAGDAAPGRHDDPDDRVVDGLASDRAERAGRQALADLVEGRHVLELLEGRARRQPQRQPAGGHRVERVGRAQPGVGGDLVAFEGRRRPVGQGGREEPGIEPAREGSGVTQRESGTSRSVRSRRSSASASSGKVDVAAQQRPSVPPRRRPPMRSSRRGGRRPPRTARGSRRGTRRGRPAASRSPPSASAASAAERTERPARPGAASSGSTRPPGKTCTSAANAIVAGRCVRRTSSPAEPGRSRTTVAAGRASTGPAVTRGPRTATTWTRGAGRPAQPSACGGVELGAQRRRHR